MGSLLDGSVPLNSGRLFKDKHSCLQTVEGCKNLMNSGRLFKDKQSCLQTDLFTDRVVYKQPELFTIRACIGIDFDDGVLPHEVVLVLGGST